jgi:hypothetical protein
MNNPDDPVAFLAHSAVRTNGGGDRMMTLTRQNDRRLALWGRMLAPLRRVYKVVEDLVRREARIAMLTWYRIGQWIHQIRHHEDFYGSPPVDLLAGVLGIDLRTLLGAASVAAAFTRGEVRQLARLALSSGAPLTFEHLIQLSRIASPRDREQAIRRTLDESLTPRQVARAIKQAQQADSEARGKRLASVRLGGADRSPAAKGDANAKPPMSGNAAGSMASAPGARTPEEY